MFRVSPAKYAEGLDALKSACDGADNIAYRTDLLLADFRPLAEGRFGEASAERGAEVGLKAKLLSLSLFALLETMRDGKDKLDAVVAARAELDAVAGSGAAEPTDPVLDATVNVSDSASILEGSANGVVAALVEAAELLVGVGWTGRLPGELAQAADCAAWQLAYAQSAASAYADYAKAVGDFEDALVPRLDPDGFLQVGAAREWAGGEIAGGGPGIGEWLAAIGDAADGAGGSLGAVGGMLRGFGVAVEGNESALSRAYAAVKGLGPDGARALAKLLSDEGSMGEFIGDLEEAARRRGGDLVAAMRDVDWVKFGVDDEVAEAFAKTITIEQEGALEFYRWIDELGDEALITGEKFGKHADRLGKVAAGIDLLLTILETGPVGPEVASHVATEGAIIAASNAVGSVAVLGVGGVVGGGAIAVGGVAALGAGVALEKYKESPEGRDFQRDVDSLFMGMAGFGSVHPNDYFSEAGKREQLAAVERRKDE